MLKPVSSVRRPPPASEKLPKGVRYQKRWIVFFGLWIVCFSFFVSRITYSTLFIAIAKEFEFDDVRIGFLGSAFYYRFAARFFSSMPSSFSPHRAFSYTVGNFLALFVPGEKKTLIWAAYVSCSCVQVVFFFRQHFDSVGVL